MRDGTKGYLLLVLGELIERTEIMVKAAKGSLVAWIYLKAILKAAKMARAYIKQIKTI